MVKIKLRDVVETMDMLADEMSGYLNKRTGELHTLNDEEIEAAELEADDAGDEGLADQPEWLRDEVQKAREINESEDWVELPTKRDIHEYSIMEKFCRSVTDPGSSEKLLDAIRGSGAFRRFRGVLEIFNLEREWYDFRAAELEKIAVQWMEENQIEYARD